MRSHSEFLNALGAAIASSSDAAVAGLDACKSWGLAVYRNTIASGCIDAMAASFPTVVKMTGEPWFRAAARLYTDVEPPRTPTLLTYGQDFSRWLATFPPALDTPYLADVASFDWLWWQAYFSEDVAAIGTDAFGALDIADISSIALVAHPALRLAATTSNSASLWLLHQDGQTTPSTFSIENRREFLLITRPALTVQSELISPGTYAFLLACQRGARLDEAAEAALEADPDCDFASLVATCASAGALTTDASSEDL